MTTTLKCRYHPRGYVLNDPTVTHVICDKAFSLCYNEWPPEIDLTISTEPLEGGIKVVVIHRFVPEALAVAIGIKEPMCAPLWEEGCHWFGAFYMRAEGLVPNGRTLVWGYDERIES